MATGKKSTVRSSEPKKTTSKKVVKFSSLRSKILNHPAVRKSRAKLDDFLARRPHRSFRRTYRRDYVRSLALPGYWSFTNYVASMLWANKRLFAKLLAVYGLVTIAVIGLASQDIYNTLRETLNETSPDANLFTGAWGEISQAGLLLLTGVTGSFNENSTSFQTQQGVLAILIGLLTWLTVVWLLRAILAGRKPNLRDGMYNSGSPILPTSMLVAVVILQLLPFALALFGYNSAVSTGLLDGGVESMLFWTIAALLAVLSLYWITSTLIALVIITLPGMYPMQALRTAGDLVIGRRIRILLRFLWLILVIVVLWVLIMIPVIIADGWLKDALPSVQWVPVIPLMLMIMSALTIVWTSSYVYLLYRKVVDDDAAPA